MKNLKHFSYAVIAFLILTANSFAGDYGKKKDIVDVAASNPEFSTLVTAIKAAGLVDALKGVGPLTVFAPNNAAFEKLPQGTLDTLLKPENKEMLVSILTYHVVSGKVTSGDVVKVDSAKSLQGQSIDVKVTGNEVMVDGANVIAVDVEASNGVIHVIDQVILPKQS